MTLTDGYCNIRPVTNREEMHFPDVHISMTDVGERERADGKAGKLAKRTLTQRASDRGRRSVPRKNTAPRRGNKGTAFALMLNKEHEHNQPRDRIHRITYYVFPGFVQPELTKYANICI